MGSLTVPLMDAPSSGTDEQRWGRLGRAAFWGLRQVGVPMFRSPSLLRDGDTQCEAPPEREFRRRFRVLDVCGGSGAAVRLSLRRRR